jgi:hypothetical protein
MKFALDFRMTVDGNPIDSAMLLGDVDSYRAECADLASLEGSIVVWIDGKDVCGEYADPLVRLCDQWVRKLPWIIGGDTETVALRNVENVFAFVPEGDSVEISYFTGSETEIEDYIIEPQNIRLESFVTESLRVAERLVEFLTKADPEAVAASEDCQDLQNSLSEARRAWKDYQLKQRR